MQKPHSNKKRLLVGLILVGAVLLPLALALGCGALVAIMAILERLG